MTSRSARVERLRPVRILFQGSLIVPEALAPARQPVPGAPRGAALPGASTPRGSAAPMNKTRQPLPTPDPPSLSRSRKIELLVQAFTAARAAAIAADPGPRGDAGAANVDCPAFHVPRISRFLILVAAHQAGVDIESFSWHRQRWFRLGGFLEGRGHRRTAMARAAAEALAKGAFPGLKVRVHYRMRF